MTYDYRKAAAPDPLSSQDAALYIRHALYSLTSQGIQYKVLQSPKPVRDETRYDMKWELSLGMSTVGLQVSYSANRGVRVQVSERKGGQINRILDEKLTRAATYQLVIESCLSYFYERKLGPGAESRYAALPKVKRFTAEQLDKMPPGKLEQETKRADQICSAIGDELIQAGRGHERASETREKAKEGDEMAKRWAEAEDARYDLISERKRRETYHGSTKRIVRRFALRRVAKVTKVPNRKEAIETAIANADRTNRIWWIKADTVSGWLVSSTQLKETSRGLGRYGVVRIRPGMTALEAEKIVSGAWKDPDYEPMFERG